MMWIERREESLALFFILVLYATHFSMVKVKVIPWEGRNLNVGGSDICSLFIFPCCYPTK